MSFEAIYLCTVTEPVFIQQMLMVPTQWPGAGGLGQMAELQLPPSLAVRCGHMLKSRPGKARLCYLLGHLESSLFFFPSRTLPGPRRPLCVLSLDFLPPSEGTTDLIFQ